MDTHGVNALDASRNSETKQHETIISTEGLEDLFLWASDMVADSTDPRAKKIKEQKIRRSVLDLIHRNKEQEANERVAEEISYLQRRVIALMQILQEKLEDNATLRQLVVAQYFSLQKLPELEQEVKHLQQLTWFREEAEAERKQLLNSLAKLKKERDILDDLLTCNESENSRLACLLKEAKSEIAQLRARRWWHPVAALFAWQ